MGKPLLDVLRDLALDPDEQAAFESDPDGYMAQFGYDDMPVDALHEAVDLVADTLPPDVAAGIAPADDAAGEDEVATLQRLTRAGDPTGAPDEGPTEAASPVEPAPPGSTDGTEDLTRGFGDVDFDNGSDLADPSGSGNGSDLRVGAGDGGPGSGDAGGADDGAGGADDMAFGSGSGSPETGDQAGEPLPDLDHDLDQPGEPEVGSTATEALVEPIEDLAGDDHSRLDLEGTGDLADPAGDDPVDDVGAF